MGVCRFTSPLEEGAIGMTLALSKLAQVVITPWPDLPVTKVPVILL